jgi:hypothetical protein
MARNRGRFDYSALDEQTRTVVRQRLKEIRGISPQTAQDVVAIGRKLIEVKELLPRGRFGRWLTQEFEWSPRMAYNFIAAAERFGDCEQLRKLLPSALYLLAASSTPDSARRQALARAQAGEEITHETAQQIVHSCKTAVQVPSVLEQIQRLLPQLTDQERALLLAELECAG